MEKETKTTTRLLALSCLSVLFKTLNKYECDPCAGHLSMSVTGRDGAERVYRVVNELLFGNGGPDASMYIWGTF